MAKTLLAPYFAHGPLTWPTTASAQRSGSRSLAIFTIRLLANPIAPHAATRSGDAMIVVSIQLTDPAAVPDARS